MAYNFFSFSGGSIFLGRYLFSAHTIYRKQVVSLLAASLLTILVAVLHTLRISPIPNLDINPFAMIASCLILGWGVLNYDIINLTPIARDVLFENLLDGVLVVDGMATLVDFNPAAGKILRLPADAAGKPLSECVPEGIFSVLHSLKLGGNPVEIQADLTTGCAYEAYRVALAQEKQDVGNLIVLHEFSQRKNAEQALVKLNLELEQHVEQLQLTGQALRASQDGYRMLLENAVFPLVIVNLADNHIMFCNRRAAELFEAPAEVLVGNHAVTLYASAAGRVGFLEPLMRNGHVSDYEVELITASGKRFWALLSSQIISYEGRPAATTSFNNITDQKLAHDKLRESEERYRLLAEYSNDVIWTMDLNGRFTYVSPAVQNLRGYTPDEVLAQSLDEVICPGSLPIVLSGIQRSIKAARENHPIVDKYIEIEQPCKKGGTVWTEATARLIMDDQGAPAGFVGVSRNISERKRIQDQLQETLSELTLFNQAMVGREIRMIELKQEINELMQQDGSPPRYVIPTD
jgi:PAS domain S-box-containing protein